MSLRLLSSQIDRIGRLFGRFSVVSPMPHGCFTGASRVLHKRLRGTLLGVYDAPRSEDRSLGIPHVTVSVSRNIAVRETVIAGEFVPLHRTCFLGSNPRRESRLLDKFQTAIVYRSL